jgi:Mlc titration factor MtfA (ptsG expression regulator)
VGDLGYGLAVVLTVAAVLAAAALGARWALPRLLRAAPAVPGRRLPVPPEWWPWIEQRAPQVAGLSPPDRDTLLQLVARFIREKRFEGAGGAAVTDEMKVVIAAQACFLTLKVPGPLYPSLSVVVVYPGGFVARQTEMGRTMNLPRHHGPLAGEAMSGVVALDWEDVLRGAAEPRDGRNVVFHEFAHQLDYEDGRAGGVPVLPADTYQRWGAIMRDATAQLEQSVNDGVPSALDPYGTTNRAEFFAVATEAFFERPDDVRAEYPALFEALRQFYGQDPGRA